MLGKLKNFLGIESVKVDLFIPEEVQISNGSLSGQAVFTSQTDQFIQSMTVKLIEKYKRGRKDAQLINEYLLGSIQIALNLPISAGEKRNIDFELPFNMMLSEMDRMADKNLLVRGFVRLAKKLKNVSSEYKVEITAKVQGTKLNPVVTKKIELV